MSTLREEPLKEIAGYQVLKIRDYQKDTILDLVTGAETDTGLPKSNVLYYELTDDAWLCVRPSGTEPKIKFSIGVRGKDFEDGNQKAAALLSGVRNLAGV